MPAGCRCNRSRSTARSREVSTPGAQAPQTSTAASSAPSAPPKVAPQEQPAGAVLCVLASGVDDSDAEQRWLLEQLVVDALGPSPGEQVQDAVQLPLAGHLDKVAARERPRRHLRAADQVGDADKQSGDNRVNARPGRQRPLAGRAAAAW